MGGIYLLTVSCLTKGVKAFEARWIGWAGVNVPDEVGQKALTKALAEKVFTSFSQNRLNILLTENCYLI